MGKSIYSAGQEKLQELLCQVRREAKLTQTALARKLRRPQSYVSKIESGERRLDLIELRQLCKATGISLTDFLRRFEQTVRD